ncbi:MAG TPA: GIDE domain-containing protein [Gammaproteobacteria bacterium]|jgi:hypothetical protein|nr:GIDE domain-containing protein [Gammaproteobacteria bacterium]
MTPMDGMGWVQELGTREYLFLLAAAWAACVFGFFGLWRSLRRLRLVEGTPKSLIRSAAQGYVELQGDARLMPGDPILAPLTRQHCVWWSYRIERYRRSGRNSSWDTVEQATSEELFLVDDGTGQCVVDPDGAEVYPSCDDTWYGSTPMPEGGPALGRMALGSEYRYTERRVHERDTLYTLGWFHTQGPTTGADIDLQVAQQLRAWKQDKDWLLRQFDANRDGQIDQQEWDAARAEARRLVLAQEREAMQRPAVNVLGRDPDGRTFILSTLPQGTLTWRLRLYATLALAGFIGGGALGTYLLHARFG